MKTRRLLIAGALCAIGGTAALVSRGGPAEASDHDDGETDIKSRALNLTDHFVFTPDGGTSMALVMYFNPRSLPGKQYFLSANARYEFHLTKVGARNAVPAPKDDYVFRFEASAPTASGDQFITLTALKDGNVIGSHIGKSATLASSQSASPFSNTATIDSQSIRYFVGMRADSFHFDVNRFFQVRAFLAQRFFGKNGMPDGDTPALAPNCEGDAFLAGATDVDGDQVNLWNPPSCAPDFTKNLNVTAIVLTVPKALLGGGNVFDTWSSISVLQ
jgi:Domain of unknown function (DUF4331)